MRWWLGTWLVLVSLALPASPGRTEARLLAEFTHPGHLNLSHITLHRGRLFLAAANTLYQVGIYRII